MAGQTSIGVVAQASRARCRAVASSAVCSTMIVGGPSWQTTAGIRVSRRIGSQRPAFSGVPQHPVALALQPVVAGYRLPQEHFQTVIDGMAMDLERNRYLDFADLERYCHCVAGVVGLKSAENFCYVNPDTRLYARDLGIAFQLTNIIRDVGEDARRGRIYLPQDELARHGVTAASLMKHEMTSEMVSLMTEQVERARRWHQRALEALPPEDRRMQRPGLIMAAIYRALLDEIERDGYSVLDHRIALTPLRKLWIAWKTARRD